MTTLSLALVEAFGICKAMPQIGGLVKLSTALAHHFRGGRTYVSSLCF